MPAFRCSYCKGDLGDPPNPKCPHCGRVMLLPKEKYPAKKRAKKRIREDDRPAAAVPYFRPGKNPTILGGIILLFIVLGTMLSSQLQTQPDAAVAVDDPITRAEREVEVLSIALQHFFADTGRFPTESEGLVALVQDPGVADWNGHYVNLVRPDPWRTPYRYTLTEEATEVRSAGPDRTFNTDADIYVTQGGNQ